MYLEYIRIFRKLKLHTFHRDCLVDMQINYRRILFPVIMYNYFTFYMFDLVLMYTQYIQGLCQSGLGTADYVVIIPHYIDPVRTSQKTALQLLRVLSLLWEQHVHRVVP
jgi:hypothetical protein